MSDRSKRVGQAGIEARRSAATRGSISEASRGAGRNEDGDRVDGTF
jgi:hypothetical protein